MEKSIVPVNQLAVRSSTCYEFSNPNEAQVVEIEDEDTSVGTVEKQMEELKLVHQFNEKNVPEIFQRLVNKKMSDLEEINLGFGGSITLLVLDDMYIRFEEMNADWTITYEQVDITIETRDPEKSIIDHLWFVFKNPNIKLQRFLVLDCKNAEERQILNLEKLSTLLQSMFNSILHQIQTNLLDYEGLNEDIFLSLLKQVNPGTIDKIGFDISWREEGNYQKMMEIVETDQWKQAKTIISRGVTSLKVEDLFHCENLWLELASVTSEDVLCVVEHFFNSSCHKSCSLSSEHEKYDIDAIIDFLRSRTDGSRINKINPIPPQVKFVYTIVKFGKRVHLVGKENSISIANE